jgi:hypothetical protein
MPQTKPSNEALFVKLIHDLDEADGKADGRIIANKDMREMLDLTSFSLINLSADLVMQISEENQRNNGSSPEKPRAKSPQEMQQEQQAETARQQKLQQLYTDLNSTNKSLHFVTALETHLFKENQPDGAGYRIDCPDIALKAQLEAGDFASVLRQCLPQEGVPAATTPKGKRSASPRR